MSADFETGFFVSKPAWHRLGVVLDQAPENSVEALEKAGLDWKVEKHPMYLADGTLIPETYAMVRDTDNSVLGTVGKRYTPLQNEEAFKFFDPIIKDNLAKYETAGSLLEGRKVWILAKLTGEVDLGEGDKIDKYVLLSNTHDGSGTVVCKVTPVRVVCNNTLSAALNLKSQKEGDEFKIRHTKTVNDRVSEASKLLTSINEQYEKLESLWKEMVDVSLTPQKEYEYLQRVLPDPETSKNATGIQKKRVEIKQLSMDTALGGNLSTARNTLWGIYNGVTAYADHMMSNRKDATEEKHLNEMWFGNRKKLKNAAMNVALEMLEETKKVGV